ncbi:O-acetyl-ADP-ribose deacetylase [Candidatus Woesearchaeota archaeon]|nr:O-acetyl-ADP-ribose deacetylase [Candidatus Woesearchaeota archaeon]
MDVDIDIEIIMGDITKLNVDAIVNAANSSLYGGGGVDGAIHRAAGEGLLRECERIRSKPEYVDGLDTGQAVITKGYNLPAKHVIHTVGPIYDAVPNPAELLANSYWNSLKLAEENKLKSIAFPAISTGVFGYPKEEALMIVDNVISAFDYNSIKKVILCYFSEEDRVLAEKEFDK